MSMLCWLCNKTIPDADAAEHACCKAAPVDGERERLLDELDLIVEHGWPGQGRHTVRLAAETIRSLESQISALRAAIQPFVHFQHVRSAQGGTAPKTGPLYGVVSRNGEAELTVEDFLRLGELAIPSAASIGEGGLGDAGREMK